MRHLWLGRRLVAFGRIFDPAAVAARKRETPRSIKTLRLGSYGVVAIDFALMGREVRGEA